MGQYHYTCNLSKRQFLHPHKLGDGLKLHEQCGWSPGGTNDALHLLLACSGRNRGGGDFQDESDWIGFWAGDRIAVVGDYADDDDMLSKDKASEIYLHCSEGTNNWRDITDELIPILEREYEVVYLGEGWRERISFSKIEGYGGSHGHGDRTIILADQEYPASQVRAALAACTGTVGVSRGTKQISLKVLQEAGLKPAHSL